MKRYFIHFALAIALFISILPINAGFAFGHTILISDPEKEIGLLLSPSPGECDSCRRFEGVVLDPEKLTLLGLAGTEKGDKVRMIHQAMNLWRIKRVDSGATVRIRVKSKSGAGDSWLLPMSRQ